ncbi:unnamed protein product [Rodentolepis nana]|uniref:PDEase domain-containing protein n=1 Tax=Rodentolepis nana TaxID=102285 RepID=A0A0R3TFY4_RODNA|nr:unnamed protein product [Rodentolepis nana]
MIKELKYYFYTTGCAINLPPRGAPWATYIHKAKKSINWQLTSHFKLPSPHSMSYSTASTVITSPFFYLCDCFFYIFETLFCSPLPPLDFFHFDMYASICSADLPSLFCHLDLFTLLFSAICHDLDHPGLTNVYQSRLSILYNTLSPLENHHCAVAFELVRTPATNIFINFTNKEFEIVRQNTVRCILGTDMSKHTDILEAFTLTPVDELSSQVNLEQKTNLPLSPLMDMSNLVQCQINFLSFAMLPLAKALISVIPALEVRHSSLIPRLNPLCSGNMCHNLS